MMQMCVSLYVFLFIRRCHQQSTHTQFQNNCDVSNFTVQIACCLRGLSRRLCSCEPRRFLWRARSCDLASTNEQYLHGTVRSTLCQFEYTRLYHVRPPGPPTEPRSTGWCTLLPTTHHKPPHPTPPSSALTRPAHTLTRPRRRLRRFPEERRATVLAKEGQLSETSATQTRDSHLALCVEEVASMMLLQIHWACLKRAMGYMMNKRVSI